MHKLNVLILGPKSFISTLNESNIVNTTIIQGKKHETKQQAKLYSLCIRAQADLHSLSRDNINFDTLFSNILKALLFLEINKIVHSDITPSNILIYQDLFKLTDFGLSLTQEDSYSFENLDPKRNNLVAPEIFSGTQKASHKADIWSFGLTFLLKHLNRDQKNWILKKLQKLNIASQLKQENIKDCKNIWLKNLDSILKKTQKINHKFKPVLTKMLEPNPSNRPNASEIYHQLQ